jgi:hypothetical protein
VSAHDHCSCPRCDLLAEMEAAREDETLASGERAELLSDLRADLERAARCPRQQNAHGLTFDRWANAAQSSAPRGEQLRAWARGEDPADHRVDEWPCPACGGATEIMGRLGSLVHARCRACGADSSRAGAT